MDLDPQSAMQELPTAYAVALRLHGAGLSDDDVALALDVPTEAVPQLLEIGASKLQALLGDDPDAVGDGAG